MTSQSEKLELIRQAHAILARIDAAFQLPWFAEEAEAQAPETAARDVKVKQRQ